MGVDVADLPAGWRAEPLVNCTSDGNISYGIVQPGRPTPHGIPMLRVNNIQNGSLDLGEVLQVSAEIEAGYKRTRLAGGEIILTLVGSTGQSLVVPHELAGWNVARAIAVIRPKPELSANWINICLKTGAAQHFLDVRANTTVQKTLNLKDVKEIPIVFPPEGERKKIELIAVAIDDKIALNLRMNRTLEALAQVIFKSWFVDFEPVRAKAAAKADGADSAAIERAAMAAIAGRSIEEAIAREDFFQDLSPENRESLARTSACFPDTFQDSELGEIPEGWRPSPLSKMLQLEYGKALKKSDRQAGTIPVYGSGGVTGYHNSSLVIGPGIIVGRKGSIGSIFWEGQSFFPIDTVFFVKPLHYYSLEFIYCLLKTLGLNQMNTDAAVPGLNRNNVYRLEVPDIPMELVVQFSRLTGSLLAKIGSNDFESSTLSQLRDTLLPKLLSGELKVPEVETQAEEVDGQ
jgi:type I restriction enzyme, S subunit